MVMGVMVIMGLVMVVMVVVVLVDRHREGIRKMNTGWCSCLNSSCCWRCLPCYSSSLLVRFE